MMPTHGEAFIAFHASEEIILGFFLQTEEIYTLIYRTF